MILSPARRRTAIVVLLMVAGGALLGCEPKATPSPTPTALFASEEEAFAAAEELYRAYTDALNEIDPTHPETFEPIYALTSGRFEAADRENFSLMHAEHHVISGDAQVQRFKGSSASDGFTRIDATACLDVSDVRIVDADGISLVSADRPDVYPLSITFVLSDGRLAIDSATRIESEVCAGA